MVISIARVSFYHNTRRNTKINVTNRHSYQLLINLGAFASRFLTSFNASSILLNVANFSNYTQTFFLQVFEISILVDFLETMLLKKIAYFCILSINL